MSVADSIMVGKFLGTIPLAAISLAVSILIIPMVFAIGVAYGLTPLVAGADGKEDPAEAQIVSHRLMLRAVKMPRPLSKNTSSLASRTPMKTAASHRPSTRAGGLAVSGTL